MPVLAPADLLWVELPPVRSNVFCRSIYCIYIDISLQKTKNINTNIYISLEQLRIINMQWTSAIEMFEVLSKCGFHQHHCQSQPQSFYFINLFLWRNDGKFWYKWIHHCTYSRKIDRAPRDYQIRRWYANRWNRTMSVLFVIIALVI